jgi:hypothetical protein
MVSQTHSNASSGYAIEGFLTSGAISGNAFERDHTQRNRVPSRLASTVEKANERHLRQGILVVALGRSNRL